MANRNKQFNGNKHCVDPHNVARRFYCCFEQDRVKTGERLALYRTEKHMSRKKFVEFLERGGFLSISETTLWNWETGRGKIGDEEIEALCAALGRRRDELVVYRIREIDDERDQPVHSNYILIFRRAFAQASARLFFVNLQLMEHVRITLIIECEVNTVVF